VPIVAGPCSGSGLVCALSSYWPLLDMKSMSDKLEALDLSFDLSITALSPARSFLSLALFLLLDFVLWS